MIPFVRSLTELMMITEPKYHLNQNIKTVSPQKTCKEQGESKFEKPKDQKSVSLPVLPKLYKNKWTRGKEIVSKLLDELDYNNQIQSSYDLILLDRQKNYENQDAA